MNFGPRARPPLDKSFLKRYSCGMSILRRIFISAIFLVVEVLFAGYFLWGAFALFTVMMHWDATPSNSWNVFGWWIILLGAIGTGLFAMAIGYRFAPRIDSWLTKRLSWLWLPIVLILVIVVSVYGHWRYQHPVKMVRRWNPKKHVVELQPE